MVPCVMVLIVVVFVMLLLLTIVVVVLQVLLLLLLVLLGLWFVLFCVKGGLPILVKCERGCCCG